MEDVVRIGSGQIGGEGDVEGEIDGGVERHGRRERVSGHRPLEGWWGRWVIWVHVIRIRNRVPHPKRCG